jgi:hypothetical protein
MSTSRIFTIKKVLETSARVTASQSINKVIEISQKLINISIPKSLLSKCVSSQTSHDKCQLHCTTLNQKKKKKSETLAQMTVFLLKKYSETCEIRTPLGLAKSAPN